MAPSPLLPAQYFPLKAPRAPVHSNFAPPTAAFSPAPFSPAPSPSTSAPGSVREGMELGLRGGRGGEQVRGRRGRGAVGSGYGIAGEVREVCTPETVDAVVCEPAGSRGRGCGRGRGLGRGRGGVGKGRTSGSKRKSEYNGVESGGVQKGGKGGGEIVGVNKLLTDTQIELATALSRGPKAPKTAKRYKPLEEQHIALCLSKGVDIAKLDPNKRRERSQHPMYIAMGHIWALCGPAEYGCQNLKANGGTGEVAKSAIVAVYRKLGYESTSNYKDLGDGRFSGNPGQALGLKSLLDVLSASQSRSNSHNTVRARVETHEDIREIYRLYIQHIIDEIVVFGRLPSQE